MAKIRSGILGQTTGKVAGVVGGTWKGINYIREYVKPANPRTIAQQVQRSKMSLCVAFIKPAIGPVLNVYMDPITVGKSAYNQFTSSNISKFENPIDYSSIVLTEGKLFAPAITGVTPPSPGQPIVIPYNSTNGSNGSQDDKIYAGAYSTATGSWYFPDAEVERKDGEITINSVGDEVPLDLILFVWAVQYQGLTVKAVSTSNGYLFA